MHRENYTQLWRFYGGCIGDVGCSTSSTAIRHTDCERDKRRRRPLAARDICAGADVENAPYRACWHMSPLPVNGRREQQLGTPPQQPSGDSTTQQQGTRRSTFR
jgi:hypothetical protein